MWRRVSALSQKESDTNATAALPVVEVDLAKSVFQLAVADGSWRVVEFHRLTRTQFERWFANRAVGLVVIEACGSAHHWARRPSWQTGSPPPRLTLITLPATACLPLATIGAAGSADSMSARTIMSPLQMPDIRLTGCPYLPHLSINLFPCGGSPYTWLGVIGFTVRERAQRSGRQEPDGSCGRNSSGRSCRLEG
jgi:hypothetical protein